MVKRNYLFGVTRLYGVFFQLCPPEPTPLATSDGDLDPYQMIRFQQKPLTENKFQLGNPDFIFLRLKGIVSRDFEKAPAPGYCGLA